jgi:hypothetical protein
MIVPDGLLFGVGGGRVVGMNTDTEYIDHDLYNTYIPLRAWYEETGKPQPDDTMMLPENRNSIREFMLQLTGGDLQILRDALDFYAYANKRIALNKELSIEHRYSGEFASGVCEEIDEMIYGSWHDAETPTVEE